MIESFIIHIRSQLTQGLQFLRDDGDNLIGSEWFEGSQAEFERCQELLFDGHKLDFLGRIG